MRCGDTSRFAIEFEIKSISSTPWVYGLYFFWANGRRYGDDEDSVTLNCAAGGAKLQLESRIDLISQELYDMTAAELFELAGRPEDAPSEYYKFRVDELGTSTFDRDREIFLLVKSSGGMERLVWYSDKDQQIGEVHLGPGEFECVLSIFLSTGAKVASPILLKSQIKKG